MTLEERRVERLRNKLTPFFTLIDICELFSIGEISTEKFVEFIKKNKCDKLSIKILLDEKTTIKEMMVL